MDYEHIERFDVRLAYRMYDVRTTYNGVLKQKPLLAKHRAFVNLAYQTRNRWSFDYTLNWQGKKRIPYAGNDPAYQLALHSPNFVLMNVQVSKAWGNRFEVYAGVENLLDYTQENPIISSEDPSNPRFDSSIIWDPVFGRNAYAGLRFKIQ